MTNSWIKMIGWKFNAATALLMLTALTCLPATAEEMKHCTSSDGQQKSHGIVLVSGRAAALDAQHAKLSAALSNAGLRSVRIESIEVDEFQPASIPDQLQAQPQLKGKVLVTLSGIVAHALSSSMPQNPVVFASLDDPVEAGIVNSLGMRKQNATGVSYAMDLEWKALEHFRLAFPFIRSVGLVLDEHSAKRPTFKRLVRDAERKLGLQVLMFVAETPVSLDRILASPSARNLDAWYVPETAIVLRHEDSTLRAFALLKKPALFGHPSLLKKGAVMVFGAEFSSLWQEIAQMVRLVCAGTLAREIPIVRPHRIFLGASAANARRLGLEIDPRIFKLATIID